MKNSEMKRRGRTLFQVLCSRVLDLYEEEEEGEEVGEYRSRAAHASLK